MKSHVFDFKSDPQHPRIIVGLDERIQDNCDWLYDFFSEKISSQGRFCHGEEIQIGWSIVEIRSNDDGDLELWEPSLRSFPIVWEFGINNVIRNLLLQREICRQCKVEPQFPSMFNTGIAASSFFKDEINDFVMSREAVLENDSGWFFSEIERQDTTAALYSLFEIAFRCPKVVPFLALPSDFTIAVTRNEILIEGMGKKLSSSSNEFLAKLR